MKTKLLTTILFVILIFGLVLNANAADRYWVGGTDTWDATAGTKWATTSGGVGGAAVPTSSDDVFFDSASGAVTVTLSQVNMLCKNADFTGFTGTFAGNQPLNIWGTLLTFGSNMTMNFTGVISFHITSGTCIITSNGITLHSILRTTQGGSEIYQLADDLITTSSIEIPYGTFNANNKNVTCASFNSSYSSTRTIIMGSGTWELTGTGTVWDCTDTTNLTLNCGTSTIKITDVSNYTNSFKGGGETYYDLWFDRGTAIGGNRIYNSNTFNNIKDIGTNAHAFFFEDGTNQTITSSTISGSTGNLIVLQGTSAAGWTISCASGTITVDYCDISYSTATGGATFNATNSTDGGNNTGWIFTTTDVQPPSTQNTSICGPGTLSLTASGADSSEIYNWYDSPIAGTLLLSDTAHTIGYISTYTVNLIATDTFWVAIDSAGYESVRVPAIGFVFSPGQTVTDTINKFIHDGRDCQNYPIVKIGNQWWMAENLNAAKYRDGSVIPNVTNVTTWSNLTTGALCYYNNDSSLYAETYSSLYNWYAVNDNRKIAPVGWHVATDSEWNIMEKYLDNTVDTIATGWVGTDIGGKLKETGTTHWASPNTGATNSSGFTSLPGGQRSYVGSFYDAGQVGNWWSATEFSVTYAWLRGWSYSLATVYRGTNYKTYGFSVRCVKNTCNDVAVTVDTTVCHGGSVSIGSSIYDSTGTYIDTLLTSLGCDSIVTTNLTVVNIADISNVNLQNGLVAYYPFNGNANDESGNGNDGTVNGATLTTDRFGNAGKAYSFDGVSNSIDNSTITNLTSVQTKTAWIKPYTVAGGSNLYIIDEGGNNNWMQLYDVDFDSKLELKAGSVPPNVVESDFEFIQSDTWYFVAVTQDVNNVMKLYVNGVLDYTGTVNSVSSPLITIGKFSNNSCYFNGIIDDIRIYNRALNAQEIQALYEEQNPMIFTSECHDLNDNQIPQGWTFEEALATANISGGKMNAFVTNAEGRLSREGIIPDNTSKVVLEWDGDNMASTWGRSSHVKMDLPNGNRLWLSNFTSGVDGPDSYVNIILANSSDTYIDTLILKAPFSFVAAQYHYKVFLSSDSVGYCATNISDQTILFNYNLSLVNEGIVFPLDSVVKITFLVGATTDNSNWLDNPCITIYQKSVISVSISNDTICSGTSSTLEIINSQPGISYQLLAFGDTYHLPQIGNSDTLNFNISGLSGLVPFTISAIDTATGCNIVLDTVLNVFFAPAVSVNLGPDRNICAGQTVTLDAGLHQQYHWNNGSSTAWITVQPAVTTTYSVTVTDNGCTATDSVIVNVSTANCISLTTSSTPTNCADSTGTATAVPTGGTTPYSFQWTSGDTLATALNLAAGIYGVTVTDAAGNMSYSFATVGTSSGPVINPTVTNVLCYGGSTGNIAISVSGGSFPYQFLWSNGDTTQNISNLVAGSYDIQVKDAANCISVLIIAVNQPQPLAVNVTTTTAACSGSNGSATVWIMGGTTPYTINWSTGEHTNVVTGLSAGSYSVTIIDGNGCVSNTNTNVVIENVNAPVITLDSIVNANCSSSNGSIYVSVSGGSLPYTFNWTGGFATEDLTNAPTGIYDLQVTDNAGCIGMYSGQIEMVLPQIQPICMVTVDSATGTNLVVWEKVASSGIDYYKIYRESSMPNQYLLVDTVHYASMSEFTDPVANPFVRSWRYKISAVDMCGNESPLSDLHKTIHLTVNEGMGNSYNLIWDDYEGFPYYTFYVNRHTNALGWIILDSLPNTLHSFTNVPPTQGGLKYLVTVKSPNDCVPTSENKANGGPYSHAHSNMEDVEMILNIEYNVETNEIIIYPNPFSQSTTIAIPDLQIPNSKFQVSNSKVEITITDVTGKTVRTITNPQTPGNRSHLASGYNDAQFVIERGNLKPGIYFVELRGDKVYRGKLIIE